jgi:hypothetical protein
LLHSPDWFFAAVGIVIAIAMLGFVDTIVISIASTRQMITKQSLKQQRKRNELEIVKKNQQKL